MKYLFALLIIPLLVPANAYAQIEIDYDNCVVMSAPENFYWPFEVITRHDPAIAQRITDRHVNAPNAQIAIDKPQSDKAEDATWVSFKNSANVTANWEVQVDLEYMSETQEDREVMIEMYSNNKRIANHKIMQDGKSFCIVYNLVVSNPPHDWTDEEILEVSSALTNDEFKATQKEMKKNTEAIENNTRFDNVQTAVLAGLAVAIIVGGWKARDRIKVENKLLRYEREQLEEARMNLEMNDDYRNLKILNGLQHMQIEKNRIYQDVINMIQVAFSKKDEDPVELAKEVFEDIQKKQHLVQNPIEPSDSKYIPGPVEFDLPDDYDPLEDSPGLKKRISQIKSKLPFVGSKEKTFEEYTEDYLWQELENYESKAEQTNHLKKIWDERIKVAHNDPSGVASREIEVIRKVWQELIEQ